MLCACRLGLNVFSMQLNELLPDLEAKLPPTDTRWRRDLRAMETGAYAKASFSPSLLLAKTPSHLHIDLS